MTDERYSPPKSRVEDQESPKSKWFRVTWSNIPMFVFLVLVSYSIRDAWLDGVNVVTFSFVVLFIGTFTVGTIRKIVLLDETPGPWWGDVLYYVSLTVFLLGIFADLPEMTFIGLAPTVVLNGVTGITALLVERQRGVRLYAAGRRLVVEKKNG